jgi:pimeloyl-ACP methyl ester carboxylesterase
MLPLKTELEKSGRKVYAYDFPGHGGAAFPNEDFSIAVFAEAVLKWMEEHKLAKVNIFGYSMGGYVALYLAHYYPEKVSRIVTLGTKLEWDHYIAADMARMIDSEKIAAKAPVLADALEKMHTPNDWKEVLHRTTEMFLKMGNGPALSAENFKAITIKVLMLLGDQDRMVTREETEEVVALLPDAEMKILAGTPHPIEQANAAELAKMTADFFS